MPKYQEIKGEIYVEGGPECLVDQIVSRYPQLLKHGPITDHNNMPSWYSQKVCRECHGTGAMPLSKWSDKVKADWLAENPPKSLDGCLDCSEDDLVILWNRIEKLWYVIYQSSKKGFATVTYGPHYSAVLTVAVTIVARGENEARD